LIINKINRIDFIVREGNTITQIWQVVVEKLEEPEVLERELQAIAEAKKIFPKAEAFIVSKTLPEQPLSIPYKMIPLWLFLLEKDS
jgi:predicted AAA+ superfamily ATPase